MIFARRLFAGMLAGLFTSFVVLQLAGFTRGHSHVHTRLVAEDASAPLARVAIHYAPSSDRVALAIWTQLFAVLPARVEVDVEVSVAGDFARFTRSMRAAGTPSVDRFHPVIVGAPITTWSRDRYAALVDDRGGGAILAPPRVESATVSRAGDARSPAAISNALYGRDPEVANIVFEGGDLAATPHYVFADVNLVARNAGRDAERASRPRVEAELARRFGQDIVWLGGELGDVPRHHIMMYMVPLDDHTIAVGDVRAGVALLAHEPPGSSLVLDDIDLEARRFDNAAMLLMARGFHVVRVPALVLAGAGAFVTYTNALFDRRADGTRVVYLPTYSLPALDQAARQFYEANGFEVHPIDVTPIYRLNGSLGCLVNVLARAL